jgi:hypothetical protein
LPTEVGFQPIQAGNTDSSRRRRASAKSRITLLEIWPSRPATFAGLMPAPRRGAVFERAPRDSAQAHTQPDNLAKKFGAGRLPALPLMGRILSVGSRPRNARRRPR